VFVSSLIPSATKRAAERRLFLWGMGWERAHTGFDKSAFTRSVTKGADLDGGAKRRRPKGQNAKRFDLSHPVRHEKSRRKAAFFVVGENGEKTPEDRAFCMWLKGFSNEPCPL